MLRKLTVLHSNLAASAAKNQRSFAKVVTPNTSKSGDNSNCNGNRNIAKENPSSGEASPTGSLAVSSLLSMPESANSDLESERRSGHSTPSANSKVHGLPTLPALRSSSVPHLFHSSTSSSHVLPGNAYSTSHMSKGNHCAPGSMSSYGATGSPLNFLGRGMTDTPFSVETKANPILPPLAEISSKHGSQTYGSNQRPIPSRSLPVPSAERPPMSLDVRRRATIAYGNSESSREINNFSCYALSSPHGSPRTLPSAGKYPPTHQFDYRHASPRGERPSSGSYVSTFPPGGLKRPPPPLPHASMSDKYNETYAHQNLMVCINYNVYHINLTQIPTEPSISPGSVEPNGHSRDDSHSRPLKKSRSNYFSDGFPAYSPSYLGGRYRFHDITPGGVGLAPRNIEDPRLSQVRSRNMGRGLSFDGTMDSNFNPNVVPPHPPPPSRRWSSAEFSSSNYKDIPTCAKSNLHYSSTTRSDANGLGTDYHHLTRKRNVEKDAH